MFILFHLICPTASFLINLGTYQYSKYFGPTLYDTTGPFHGFTGSEISPDIYDVVQTDRGLYFDGISTYATQHSPDWFTVGLLPTPLCIVAWVFGHSDGPIIAREDENTQLDLFEIRYLDTTPSLQFSALYLGSDSVHYPLSYEHPISRGKVYIGVWTLVGAMIDFDGTSGILRSYVDTTLVDERTINSCFYHEDDMHRLKTILGINSDRESGGSWLYSLSVFSDATIDWTLFYVSSSSDVCYFGANSLYCSCPAFDPQTGSCISTNPDPLQDGNGTPCTNYVCDAGCTADGLCLTLDPTQYPVKSIYGETFAVDMCHSDCAACFGPLDSDCTVCSDPLKFVGTSSVCECINGYYTSLSTCFPCHSDCASCDQADVCLTCNQPNASPDPLHGCACNTGFFFNGSFCELCNSNCLTCNQLSTCLTCSIAGADPQLLCTCPQGTYLNSSNCDPCDLACDSCSDGQTCITCLDPNASPTTFSCVCNPGFYGDGLTCLTCNSACLTCSTQNVCDLCVDALCTPNDSGGCDCPNPCECDTGTYCDGITCQSCLSECSACDNEHSCTACVDSLAELGSGGLCTCKSNASLNNGLCKCESGYIESSGGCVIEGTIPSFATAEDYIIATGLASAALFGAISGNPSAIWGLLNTLDLLGMIPLHSVSLEYDLVIFFQEMDWASYFLDLKALILPSPETDTSIPEKWFHYGFTTSNFFYNSLILAITLAVVFMLWLVFSLLYCVPTCSIAHRWSERILPHFKYNIFIRLFVQSYLNATTASILSASAVRVMQIYQGHYTLPNIVGGACYLFLGLFPFIHLLLTYRAENAGNIDTHSSWYSGFLPRDTNLTFGYYSFFMIYRFFFVLNLFVFQSYFFVQLSINLALVLMQLCVLSHLCQFEDPINHKIVYATEFGIGITFSLLTLSESIESSMFKLTLIGMCSLLIGVGYLSSLLVLVSSCYGRWKKRKALRYQKKIKAFSIIRAKRPLRVSQDEKQLEVPHNPYDGSRRVPPICIDP